MRFTPAAPELVFVVAVAEGGVIGMGNAMPWRLPSDLKRFRALTWAHPVVMGRRTFQSIGRPLPGRTNIVVSRDRAFRAAGCVTATSLDGAWTLALGDCLRRDAASVMVIGGAEIFVQWMDRADRIEWTEVHAAPAGDAFFPAFARDEWVETSRQSCAPGDGDSASYSYVTLKRSRAP